MINKLVKDSLPGIFIIILAGCSGQPKSFSEVKTGMTNKEVLQNAGEPDKKQSIGVADLWTYQTANRTVVFRQDTVYDIVTSANARVDSIKSVLNKVGGKADRAAEKAGSAIKKGAGKAGRKIDSLIH
jgi:hypothetical protein